jgi:hypothetical protein
MKVQDANYFRCKEVMGTNLHVKGEAKRIPEVKVVDECDDSRGA